MIKLYHGSNTKVEKPDLKHSKPFKDFGCGFYLSAEKEQAWEMARLKVNQTQTGKPEVSEFLFDETLMNSKELIVLTFPGYSEEWALFVLASRDKKRPQPTHNYDIVLLLSGKHVQGAIITDFLALQAPLERKLTAVR